MVWNLISELSPPKNTRVWLYNIDNDNYGKEFVNEFDLSTTKYERNWTHWSEVIPPLPTKDKLDFDEWLNVRNIEKISDGKFKWDGRIFPAYYVKNIYEEYLN